MLVKNLAERCDLLFGIGLGFHLLARRQVIEVGNFLEELLDGPCRLIDVENSRGVAADGTPDMRRLARNEDRFAGLSGELLLPDLERQLAFKDIQPFVLVVMLVTGPAGGDFEY